MSAGISEQSLEANRLKEQVLSQSARSLAAAGKLLKTAIRGQRSVYVVGQGQLDWIGRYLAELYLSADAGAYTISARALTDRPGMSDGAPRAVEAFVCRGEVLLVLAAISTPRLERAIALALEQGAHVVGLLGLEAQNRSGSRAQCRQATREVDPDQPTVERAQQSAGKLGISKRHPRPYRTPAQKS